MKRVKWMLLVIGGLMALSLAFVAGGFLWPQRMNSGAGTATPIEQPAFRTEQSGAAVQLSQEEQQRVGVELSEIHRESITAEIDAFGRVAQSEPAVGRIWVMADVFDSDIAQIRPGMEAQITSEASPNTKLRGEVTFIDPRSDPQSRTTPVRIQVENPGNRLRPGMVVQTNFQQSLGSVLAVPQSAVIDTGKGKTVYVARDNGIFERRTIQVGSPVKDRYPILDGLKSGEKVVSNGAFLIDSQSQLTGGLTGMFGGSKSFADTAPASGYKITFRIDPDPPTGGKENTIHVSLMDSAGKPVSDAQVRMTLVMPAMPAMGMAEMRNSAELKWTGSDYSGPVQIMMAGPWSVVVEAQRGNQPLAVYRTNLSAR